MTQTAHQETPVVPRFTRGLREGAIRTRAAANGAPASASFDAEALTFEFTLLTSRSCKSYRYILTDGDRWPVYTEVEEKLDMRGVEGLDELVGSSILNSHRYWNIDDVVGVIEAGAVDGENLNCRGRLSRRDDVAPIAQDIADGVIRSVSGGYDVIEETLTMRDGKVPLVTITRWRPREASLVPVPADPSARIRSGESDMSKPAKIVAKPEGTRSAAEGTEVETTAAVETTDDVAALTAAVETARAALATATEALAKRSGATVVAAPPAPDAQRAALVDGLRTVAVRNGRQADFEAIAAAGGSVDELRSIAVKAIETAPHEISGVTALRSAAGQSVGLLSRSAYAAHRANQAN